MAAHSLEVIFKIFQKDADDLMEALMKLMPMTEQRKLKVKNQGRISGRKGR